MSPMPWTMLVMSVMLVTMIFMSKTQFNQTSFMANKDNLLKEYPITNKKW